MKTRPCLVPFSAALMVVVFALAAGTTPSLHAQDQTETKIRLMADALRARDTGDFPAALRALDQLTAMSPGDPAVQRLRAELETRGAGRSRGDGPPPVEAAALPRGEQPAPTMIEVTIPERARAPTTPPTMEHEAEIIARAESERLAAATMSGQSALAAARAQSREGRFDDAIAAIDVALGSLPKNPVTRKLIADLEEEKAAALSARSQATVQAPAATVATTAAADSGFAVEHAATAQLLAKGRAQYAAGDLDGARETFRAAEAQDPDNTVAKGFLLRIAEEKRETGVLNREKTRAQLLEEVTKGWQRPALYQERARELDRSAAVAPLIRKLNEIMVPHFHLTRATIDQTVAALGAISEQFDTTGAMPRGVNVVLLDPSNRRPEVTITLRNVSLKRLLDFITDQVGYQYEVQADAVVIRPGGETSMLDTQFFPITRATVLRMTGMTTSNAGGSSANSETISTAGEAAAMKSFLQQAGVGFNVDGSSLAYDGSAIIVTQTPRNIERIRNILARYNDVRQVEIEAKFLEVQEGALEELGVTWNVSRRGVPQVNPQTGAPILDANGRQTFVPQEIYTTGNVTRPLTGAFPSTANSGGLTIREAATATTPGGRLEVPVAPTQVPGTVQLGTTAAALASITGFVGEFDVNAVVRALSQKQGTDLLSSPKITVLSGNPASITVAQELRYPQSYGEIQSQVGSGAAAGTVGVGAAGVTITAGTPQEFTMRNVGVELKVTPTVEEDDYSISLDLNPKVTEFEGFVEYGGPSLAISGGTTVTVPPGFYQPIFSVRDISTKVTIWDGATLVMGGLTREEVKKVNDKVPFFGDIPLVGRLFRSKGESAQKRNLLIFVTANLVSPGGSPKNQSLKSTPANSLFQNPTIVTPASAEPRTRGVGSGN